VSAPSDQRGQQAPFALDLMTKPGRETGWLML
jgi:hypothetical protein